MASQIKFLDQGVFLVHILELDLTDFGLLPNQECFVVPLMRRASGFMLAIPEGFLPEAMIEQGNSAGSTGLVGPSTLVSVPGVIEEEDGSEIPAGYDLPVRLVDLNISALSSLRGFDPVTEGEGILCFSPDHQEVLPESNALMMAVYSWLESETEGRTQFYFAEEPQAQAPAPKAPARAKKAPAGGGTAQKRVTTANLAEQLAELSKSMPAISSQLETMAERQDRIEGLLATPSSRLRNQFTDSLFPPATRPAPLQFLRGIGSPPRARALPERPRAQTAERENIPEDEPELLPCDPDYTYGQKEQKGPFDVTAAIFQQSQALSTLVSHLVNQDGLMEFGAGSSSSAISLKGSAKREKLLADLTARRGDFLLKVAQNAFKRLRPTERLPRSLEEFGGRSVFAKYLERNGGFAGQRDLGLVMWLLCQIGDAMVNGDQKGAQELLALSMVAVDPGADSTGQWQMGSGMDPVTSGRPTSWRLCGQTCFDKPTSESLLPSLPARVGCHSPFFREGGRHYEQSPSRSSPCQEAKARRRDRRPKEETASLSKEAKARRRSDLYLNEDFENGKLSGWSL